MIELFEIFMACDTTSLEIASKWANAYMQCLCVISKSGHSPPCVTASGRFARAQKVCPLCQTGNSMDKQHIVLKLSSGRLHVHIEACPIRSNSINVRICVGTKMPDV